MVIGLLGVLVVLSAVACGLTLIYTGLRGTPSLSAPACAKCGYDLRGFTGEPPTTCSECGANLTRPGSIRLARLQRAPRRALSGVGVLFAIVLGIVGLRWFAMQRMIMALPANSPQAIAGQTNAQIIAGLATTASTPWGWQELDRRLSAGTLSQTDVTAAVDQYIAYRNTTGPSRPTGPLVWCDGFMQHAQAAGMIGQPQFDRLADAFFGGGPTVTIANRVAPGSVPIHLAYGNSSWDLLGWSPLFALRSVTFEDGTAVDVRPRVNYSASNPKQNAKQLSGTGTWGMDATLLLHANPGPHTLTFVIDTGLADANTRQIMRNASTPGPATQWPTNVAVKPREVKVPVTVTATAAEALQRVTDPAHAGWPPFTLKSVTAVPGDNGPAILVELSAAPTSDVDCAYDVAVTVDGKRVDLGSDDRHGRSQSSSEHREYLRAPLPPTVKTVTVTLTPNLERIARTAGVTRVWDLPIEFKNVPLRRLDLPRQ